MRIKRIISCILVGICTMIFYGCNINQCVEENNLAIVPEDEIAFKENIYTSLENDPFADDAKNMEYSLLTWDFSTEDGSKVAYLTFDDGPSQMVTESILDVLKENDVKATFFVLGSMIEKNPKGKEMIMKMVKDGHAVGNHGYSHVYDKIYPNGTVDVNNFMADMNKSLAIMKSVLGEEFHTRVVRFPGGHSTWDTDKIDTYLEENNYAFVDWNTLTGDAEAIGVGKEEQLENLKNTIEDIEGNNDKIVVLMHDTDLNEKNAETLQEIILYLKSLDYEFRTLK